MTQDHPIDGFGMTSQRSRDRLIRVLKTEGIGDPDVLEAMRLTPRHIFIEEALATRAYENTALPIGLGQTISQPYIVAHMTELATRDGALGSVLEIGTGCGYQTTILSKLFQRVYSVERIELLLHRARESMHLLGIRNVKTRYADGYLGWSAAAPFDAIVVTAAPEQIPSPLIEQLAVDGRLVIPVGGDGVQELMVVRRSATGITCQPVESVRFVPLVSGLE